MKTLRVLFILIAGGTPLLGWGTVPDSLRCRIDSLKALTHSSELSERYAGEFGIAWELYDIDNRIAAQYAGLAFKSVCGIGDSARMVKTGRLFGQLLRRVDKTDSSIQILEKVLPLAAALRDSIEQAKTLNALSIVYSHQGQYDLALTNNLKSLEIWNSLGDVAGTALALENTGVTYYVMENNIEAERYYTAALKYRDIYKSSLLYTNWALVKIALGDTVAFRAMNEKALAEMAPDAMLVTCMYYSFGYGMYFMQLGKYDLAMAYFHEALFGAERNGDFRIAAESRFKIADCYAHLGRYSEAMKVIGNMEEKLIASKRHPLRLTYYGLLSDVLENLGQLRRALLYRRKYQVLNDTINGQLVMNKVLIARVKMDEEQNRFVLSQQEEVISLKEEIIARQQLLILTTVGLLVVLLLLGLVVVRFYLFQKRVSRHLDRRVLERTRELEQSEKELTINLGQQQALMEMLSGKVQASLATFRGLWTIKFSGNDGPIDSEFEKAATELMQVPKIISRSIVSCSGRFGSNSKKILVGEHKLL